MAFSVASIFLRDGSLEVVVDVNPLSIPISLEGNVKFAFLNRYLTSESSSTFHTA